MEADFSGYATKAGLKCSDGRTITAEAFKHMDGMTVPLVWQHGHDKPENVLGHGVLEARQDGMYVYGFFNETSAGINSKQLVMHGDVKALSIYANGLVEKSKTVLHGKIGEVSLVLAGANPGAFIDQVRLAHSDGEIEMLADEAIISVGFDNAEIVHGSVSDEVEAEDPEDEPALEHADGDETIQEIYDTFNDKQKQVVHYMIGAAVESAAETTGGSAKQSASNEGDLAHQEGTNHMTNVFEQGAGKKQDGPTLSHADLKGIVETAQKVGSFKAAFEEYALSHSITDIDLLFPDAKLVGGVELIKRRTEWVNSVIDGAKHSPFSRIKSLAADLTAEEARAKGYIKGNLKKEEIIKLLRRITTPTTIYKKQKLDRDDIIDITDLDVVTWLKGEMRLMLEEELARAILIGDGREPDDEDKIDEDRLRPIAWDNEMYAHPVTVLVGATPKEILETILRSRKYYKGTGNPTLFLTDDVLTDMLLIKDGMDRREYKDIGELTTTLRVSNIVVVEVMENTPDLLCILVNMDDYTIGADKGGQVSMFDDFDIDYNQYKYLIETRASGALTKPKSAIVIKRANGNVVTPQVPAYNAGTKVLTIPTQTGVAYYDVTDTPEGTLLTPGNRTLTRTTDVEVRPTTGYTFPHNTDNDYVFTV